jgi:hypothetical protein
MTSRTDQLEAENGDYTNSGGGMDRAIQVMTEVAQTIAEQTMAKNERDIRKQQREERNAESKGLVDFRRHDPPQFLGETEPEKADLWLQKMEKIFNVLGCTDRAKVNYASSLLLGDAEYWWKGTRLMIEANNEEITWELFRTKFLDKYFPRSARTNKEQEFLLLKQGGMTIGEYAAKFESLAKYFRFFQDRIDEDWLCERFEGGLRLSIKESVLPLEIRQFQPLVEKCRKVEKMKESGINKSNTGEQSRWKHSSPGWNQKGKQPQRKPYSRPSGNNHDQQPYRPIASAVGGGQVNRQPQDYVRKCFKCGSPDHLANVCPVRGLICYQCVKPGHMAKDCPQQGTKPKTT